jgi:hypothetical protein
VAWFDVENGGVGGNGVARMALLGGAAHHVEPGPWVGEEGAQPKGCNVHRKLTGEEGCEYNLQGIVCEVHGVGGGECGRVGASGAECCV